MWEKERQGLRSVSPDGMMKSPSGVGQSSHDQSCQGIEAMVIHGVLTLLPVQTSALCGSCRGETRLQEGQALW